MPLLCADSPPICTLAYSQAANNLIENRAALAETQPQLGVGEIAHDIEWVFARDRSLTFLDVNGKWSRGCSLPRRAAMEMMQKLDVTGPAACFLAPSHAAQLQVALSSLRPDQTMIVIVPNDTDLPALLSCDHFVRDLEQHRLWFAAGEQWSAQLQELFTLHPGLCTPTQFIRLPSLDTMVDGLIVPAQKIFSDTITARAAAIRQFRESTPKKSETLCLIARSSFKLWDDAGAALATILTNDDFLRIDPDAPLSASSLALAQAAHECGAVVSANLSRADLPGIVNDAIPWITWSADGAIPRFESAGPNDQLITAIPKLAAAKGWPADRIIAANWPTSNQTVDPTESHIASLALIVNTHPLDAPSNLSDYSSHRVLWEFIAADLQKNPFALTNEIDNYLTQRMHKLDITLDAPARRRFTADLILPAYQQSLARLLIQAKIPLAIFGTGWDRIPEFARLSHGPVNTREQLLDIANNHRALVHVWPNTCPHAIDALGRPVLRRTGIHGASFLTDARQLLIARPRKTETSLPPLSADLIRRAISLASSIFPAKSAD